MPFLPQTRRQRLTLYIMVVVLLLISVDIYFGAKYSAQRDSNFRAFRWDSTTLWALKPSYQGRAWNQPINTNSAGFRGSVEYPVVSKHAQRIITFGDSRTYGFGVKDDETYTGVLEKELRQRGVDAETINAGVHGFSAVQCRARLEQLLHYKPQAAVFAPGYNDRRYLIIRPVDSSDSLPWIARIRKVVDVLQWSNTFFAFMYEVGKHKLTKLQQNPMGLDEVEPRVSRETFQDELTKIIQICRENNIKPLFLKIYQDPGSFALVERAALLYRQGDYDETVETIEEAMNTIPDRAYAMSRLILGRAYQKLGQKEKAAEAFANHHPIGSIFGESVLRSEADYYAIYDELSKQHLVPVADARKVMTVGIDDPREAEDAFRTFFIDECHYSALGHERMGRKLAGILAGLF